MKKGIDLLEEIDDREHVILWTIFEFQRGNPRGISWGELWDLNVIQRKMARQTFSRRLKDLLEKGLLEKEVVKNKRGKPTLYRLNPKLLTELKEYGIFPLEEAKDRIAEFGKNNEFLSTERYVETMMELALLQLYAWPIALIILKTEGARWLFYEANYQCMEQTLKCILDRATKDNTEKERTLRKMFEFLRPFALRPIGRLIGFDDLYGKRQKIIEEALSTAEE